MEDFLRTTRYCDYGHPAIRHTAQSLRRTYGGDGHCELAAGIYDFVSENIEYQVGKWNWLASETLARRAGTCTNNANLMVSLLRACDVPAGYRIMRVRGDAYLGPVTPKRLARHIAPTSTHIYVAVHLHGRWLQCDPSNDYALSLGIQHLNPPSGLVRWNATGDAPLNIDRRHVLADTGPIADIDPLMTKRNRPLVRLGLQMSNHYIHYLRHHGSGHDTLHSLKSGFTNWLRTNYPMSYVLYMAAPYWPVRHRGHKAPLAPDTADGQTTNAASGSGAREDQYCVLPAESE
ncbi:transglutaminase family protein [Streptomyces sp. NPDC048436]|uniref:transglutaminase-like domain-containing protein n=1 Tax=Streptomyces sp. NPDC048436 TaxID=3365550 RepID=UPI00371CFDDF